MTTKMALFIGAILAFSVAGCGDDTGTTTTTTGAGGSGAAGGAGGAGGTGGTATGGAGGTGGAAPLSCDDYCTEITTNCTGDNAQYTDAGTCKTVCATFTQGTAADMSGGTLGCRLYHGGPPAAGMPDLHCPHAGPLGDGTCGDDCKNFCAIADAVCGSQATPPFADTAACMTACAGFPDTATVPYNAMSTSGNSLACRMYHLTVASKSADNAAMHCAHLKEVSDVCK